MTDPPTPFTLNAAYDVVVIGAGLGGLGAGLQLAMGGARVLVLEQHNLPGGFATSFVRGRFEFEPSLHEIADVGSPERPGGFRKFLDEAGVAVDFVPVPDAYRLLLTDTGLDVRMPFGLEAFIDALAQRAPAARPAIIEYMKLCQEVIDALGYLEKSKGKPEKRVLMKEYGNFLRTAPYTVAQVTEALKIPKDIQDVLYAYWCYLGTPVTRLSFTIWAAMLHRYIDLGAYIPRLRSHEITLAISRRIQELGGHVEFNTRVDKILVEGGEVRGVQTEAGDRIDVRHVVANASPTLVYGRLIQPESAAPVITRRYVNARKPGASGFVVYLGLDAPAETLGLTDYGYFIGPHMDTEKLYESFQVLEPARMQASVCLNAALPEASPPGTSIVSLTTLYGPGVWKTVGPGEYVRKKNELARAMVSQFEQALKVDIRNHIEEVEVATPQTFARYTGGYEGIIYGYEPEPWDSIVPRAMAMNQEVYVKGLRFAGGNAFRCHGYNSSLISGRTSGLITLGEMGGRS